MIRLKCSDCSCLPAECRNSRSRKDCPNCSLKECCWVCIKNNLTESVRNYDLSIIDPVINIIDNKRAFLLLLEKTEEKKLSASENDQVLEG